jgi:hypothetical protein
MNIPITNILNWRKPKSTFSEGHSRYINIMRDDMMEEVLYYNNCIYHYFTHGEDNKEGIDIEYDNVETDITKDFHNQTKNIIVDDKVPNI